MKKKYIPASEWLSHYDKSYINKDLVAGLIVAIMLIPQGMAYAMLAGLPPVYGLYAATIPLIVYALFGTSRHLSVGPVALISILTLSSVSTLAKPGTDEYFALVLLLMVLVGIIQFILGLLRLGFLIHFISHAVMSGFISASAVIIGFSQLNHLLGIKLESNHVFSIIGEVINHITEINIFTLTIGLISTIILLAFKHFLPKIPGAIIVVILSMLVVYYGQLHMYGVAIVGEVPKGLPSFSLPMINQESVILLLPFALMISFIGFMESIAMAKVLATKEKEKINPNQELIGLGLANLIGSFFSAYPVTGSFSRSAVNYESGARTQLSSIFTATFILLTLLFFTSYFYYLPQAVLGAIIVIAVYGLVDVKEVKYLFSVKKVDGWIWVVTFVATITFGVQNGILIGVAFSLLVLIGRSIAPELAELGYVKAEDAYRDITRHPHAKTKKELLIFRADTSLHFANMTFLEEKMNNRISENTQVKWIILDFSGVNFIDAVAIYSLEDMIETYKQGNIEFLFVGVKGSVMETLKKAKWKEKYPQKLEYLTIKQAIKDIKLN